MEAWRKKEEEEEERREELEKKMKAMEEEEESGEGEREGRIELRKQLEAKQQELDASKDDTIRLEIDLSDATAQKDKLQEECDTSAYELKQVLLCLQQSYVEGEILRKGVLQLGGEEVLNKLMASSKEATEKLFRTKPTGE